MGSPRGWWSCAVECHPSGVTSEVTISYYTILYYTILYYTILYYTILYYTILYYTILYYTILYYTILYYTILYYTILDFTILYYTILYYTILYYTILYYTILYYTILYYTILYYTILYYTTYYTILASCEEEGTKSQDLTEATVHRGGCKWRGPAVWGLSATMPRWLPLYGSFYKLGVLLMGVLIMEPHYLGSLCLSVSLSLSLSMYISIRALDCWKLPYRGHIATGIGFGICRKSQKHIRKKKYLEHGGTS